MVYYFRLVMCRGFLLSVLLIQACSSQGDEPKAGEIPEDQQAMAIAQGDEISLALMKQLGGALKKAMKRGGAPEALSVCQVKALPLTREVSDRYPAVRVSRTSYDTRNPANAPDATDERALKRFQAMRGKDPLLFRDTEGRLRYYKPIYIQGLCLNCHGPENSLSQAVSDALAVHYPDDRATGYQEGDFRGAFKIVFKKPVK